MILVYHHNDNDGYLAASIALLELEKEGDQEKKTVVGNYSEVPPIDLLEEAEIIFILDYALSTELMETYRKKIIWIDHHERHRTRLSPLIEKYGPFYGLHELDSCGAMLTWRYFNPGIKTAPAVLQLVNARDVLDFRNPETGEEDDVFKNAVHTFHELTRSFMISYKRWQELLKNDEKTYDLIHKGRPIQRHVNGVINQLIDLYSWSSEWLGYNVAVLNCPLDVSGMLHIKLKEKYPTCDFVVIYTQIPYDKSVKYRVNLLRNNKHNNEVDVAEIARKYGGNGQKGSAGFSTTEFLWPVK